MRWLFVSAAAMSLAFATPVAAVADAASSGQPASGAQHSAQDRDQSKNRNPARQRAPKPGGATGNVPPHQIASPTRSRRQSPQPTLATSEPRRTNQRYDWSSYQPGKRPPQWRIHRDFNRRLWQRNFRAPRQYHLPPYRRPTGWYAEAWTFGMVMPALFWSRDYWITDYRMYGLDDPPYGYVWVRDTDDALLVDVTTGYVLRVVYSVFY